MLNVLKEQLEHLIEEQNNRKVVLLPHYERTKRARVESGPPGTANWYRFWDLLEIIEQSTSPLSLQQRVIMREFASQCVAHLVGLENFKKNTVYFLSLATVSHLFPFTNCVATRRFGKSRVMSLFAGLCLLIAPAVRISIFSTGLRASTALLTDTKMYLDGYPEARRRVVADNARKIRMDFGGTDKREILSLSKGVGSNKGVGGGIIIIDELTQMSLQLYYEVIVPLMIVEFTVILSITTPKGEESAYTRELLRQKESKEKIYNILEFSLACKDCVAQGIAVHCEHMDHLQPAWKSKERQRLLQICMEDVPHLYEQEGMGIPGSKTNRCFPDKMLDRFFQNPTTNTNGFMQNKLFMSIDLTGGRSSDFAVTAFGIDKECMFQVRYTYALTHVRTLRANMKASRPYG
jgi:hypothetical protein